MELKSKNKAKLAHDLKLQPLDLTITQIEDKQVRSL